jgi:hypothetical protein
VESSKDLEFEDFMAQLKNEKGERKDKRYYNIISYKKIIKQR